MTPEYRRSVDTRYCLLQAIIVTVVLDDKEDRPCIPVTMHG